MSEFYDNLLRATDNTGQISVERYATITLVNSDGTVGCLEENSELQHDFVPVLNGLSLKLGDRVVLGFVDNSVYNPFIIGVVGGESSVGVQSDWLESDTGSLAFIRNKPVIPDVSDFYTKGETDSAIRGYHDGSKQDVISDLTTIRSNASLGSTALQPQDNVSELVNDVGYLTEHQSLSDYYTQSETDSLLEDKADSVHSHSISDVSNLTSQLNSKVDKVNGKGLSTVDFTDTSYVHTDNNYTTSEKTKLAGLENYDDSELKSDIQDLQTGKADKSEIPTATSDLTNDSGFITSSYHDNSKQNTLTAGANISIVNDVISASSSTQIQSDYAQTDSASVDFIRNKPDIRQLVIDVLNEKFDGLICNATVENGKLKVSKFEDGDFDD